jgi:hypothetical protein
MLDLGEMALGGIGMSSHMGDTGGHMEKSASFKAVLDSPRLGPMKN